MTIANFKSTMIAKAKKRGGVWENFGQKELRQLEEKHRYNTIKYSREPNDVKIATELKELDYWCMTFDLSDLKNYN